MVNLSLLTFQTHIREFDNYPEGEVQEMVEIYQGKGMTKEDAVALIKILSSYKEIFVDSMLVDGMFDS